MKAPTIPICPSHLTYVDDTTPGFTRRRCGRGFTYFDDAGHKLSDPEQLQRIKSLVIPPNWQRVWICSQPDGHLQATGYDERNRKQYRYHEEWSKHRQASKFSGLADFARALPAVRQRLESDLRRRHWPREKVLALVVRLLDTYHLRIGNQAYTNSNHTYGATTLRRKHVQLENGHLALQYRAKSGKYRSIQIADRKLEKLLRAVSELPGYELFRYYDRDQKAFRAIDSHDVNQYIQAVSGLPYTAKAFRTWGGTVEAARQFTSAVKLVREHPQRKFETQLVKLVAAKLGNTITICREYYIHPTVLCTLVQQHDDDALFDRLERAKAAEATGGLDAFENYTLEVLSEPVKPPQAS
ncbi:DNA topoisomerase IB [Allohahella sp. A8]|uniref:DNA topoisomerase IB n=1 Tax=Allohahella sp. A8 TaxID=3141461 RepID=UPI0026B3020A